MSSESLRVEIKSQTPKANGEKSQAELRNTLEQRFRALKPTLDDAFAEYQHALADDTFEDTDSEPEGSGEARKVALQKKIESLVERAEGMRHTLKSGEELDAGTFADAEALKLQNQAFFHDTFRIWSNKETANKVKQEAILVAPETQNYDALAQDTNVAEFGKYTLNPETQGLDFESARVFIPNLSAFEGKPVHEVMQHVIDTYGNQYHIPGIEYWKWLIGNPSKDAPNQTLKERIKVTFFPGSVLRGRDGYWGVPNALWNGSQWNRNEDGLANLWDRAYRVVLLEK